MLTSALLYHLETLIELESMRTALLTIHATLQQPLMLSVDAVS